MAGATVSKVGVLKVIEDHFRGQSTTGILLALLFVLLVSKLWNYIRMGRKLPPGPIGLPIVGYLPFLKGDLHRLFRKMSKKYGPVFSLKLGQFNGIIINSFEAMRDSGRMDEFTARPPEIFDFSDTNTHFGGMSGKPWKEQRRFFSSTLRNIGLGKLKVEETMREQISLILEQLKSQPTDTDVDIREIIGPAINNIIMSLVCGKTYEPTDKNNQLLAVFQFKILEYWSKLRLPYYYPLARKLYCKLSSNLENIRKSVMVLEDYMSEEIKGHQQALDVDFKKDYIDFFLAEMKDQKPDSDHTYTIKMLLGNTQIILLGGSDAIRSTLEWILLCAAQNQVYQDILYKEIITVLGHDCPPEFKDREKLIMLQAFVYESMRYKTLSPLGDPHFTTADVELMGYTIPKGTIVQLNLWAVHNDKEFWGDPKNFRPERFLSPDLKSIVNSERIVTFGVGKRNCPGEKMAEIEIFLMLTSILQKFKILPPKDGVCMDEISYLTQMVVKPVVRIEAR